MSFEEQLKNFVSKVVKIKDKISTKEATKTSIIMPFFQTLGYDIFNPTEFTPEYIADVGIKKGEKVDYAIILNNEVSILIEAKAITEKLEKHDSQLFRYFGTSKAKFAILTNGLIYRFYTDLEKTNVMDTTAFLEINLEDIKDNDIQELKKFQKENFDIDYILSAASDLKYLSQIKKVLKEEFNEPTDEFIKLILNKDIYDGQKNQTVLDKYRPLIKKSLSYYVNELINERLQNAMKKNDDIEEQEPIEEENNIITTMEEMDAFYTIKSILSEYCDTNKISYKDNYNYFAVLYDNKV
ncbi:MAG: type I restriction enzyme HsdR N-terminal domain-containing protein, partial [Bacilli bacterium]